ncbi:MAG: hypothetical protein ACE37F_26060 [Nannocystaceae bacterium]|nr:hypothetical protein [bacterium]
MVDVPRWIGGCEERPFVVGVHDRVAFERNTYRGHRNAVDEGEPG